MKGFKMPSIGAALVTFGIALGAVFVYDKWIKK